MKKLFYSMLMLCAMLTAQNINAQDTDVIFQESFATGLGEFSVEGDAVWKWSQELANPSACMSAQSKDIEFVGSTYLVSPVFANGTQSTLSFNHAIKGMQKGGFEEIGKVCVREEGGVWTKLEGVEFPMGMKQLFGTEINSGDVVIPASFDNKNIQIAFCAEPIDASTAGFWFINTVVVKGKADVTPETTETIAENIAAFNALCVKDGIDVTFNLVEAQVLYINQYTDKKGNEKQEVFVRDATGSMMFYNAGLTVKVGDIMNGSVKGSAKDYFGTKEFVSTANTDFATVTITEGEATAEEKTIAEITETEVSNLVVVRGVDLISTETTDEEGKTHTNYLLVDSSNNELSYFNKFHIEGLDAETLVGMKDQIFTGIITLHYGKLQLCPVSEPVSTGIEVVESAVEEGKYYDIQGRVVENPAKGLFIHNGKKVIIK